MPRKKLKIGVTDETLLNHPQLKALIEAEHQVEVLHEFDLIVGPRAWYLSVDGAKAMPEGWVAKMIERYRKENKQP